MTRVYLIILLTLITFDTYSQKISDIKWTQSINITEFSISKSKRKLTKDFLNRIDRKRNEIAIKDKNFSKGCLGPQKHARLNWIAHNKNGQKVISMSFSGRGAQWTEYFFVFEKEIYAITIRLPDNDVLSFKNLIENIAKNEYELEDWE